MSITNVTLNNTFDEWRTTTNQLITFVNEVDTQQVINAASNSAVLTVSPHKIFRNETLYLTLNVSSDILDTSTLNVATINAVSFVYSDLTSRIDIVYDEANTINAVANAAIIQSNVARVHANTAHASANAGLLQANTARVHANVAFDQANTARVHANTAHSSANAGLSQANTAFDKANSAYDLAVALSGNTVPTLEANKAAFDNSNSAFLQANTARDHANAAFLAANNVAPQIAPTFVQANTARDHANTAYASANAGLIQANTARDHANAAFLAANNVAPQIAPTFVQANTARDHANASFARANIGFSNTSGSSFAGNMQIPTGNLSIGEGSQQGVRLHVNSWIGVANVWPQVEIMGGAQFIQFNANTNFGGWNDLMLDRDLSIIYTRGAADDGANLVIGPWTDSSFGYKQDGAGRHGFNTSNPRYTIDANGSVNVSGSLIVAGIDAVDYTRTVGTAGNNYTRTVGTAGNNYTITVGDAGNNYTRTVGTAGNNYTITVGDAGNNYTRSVGTAGNNYTITVGTAGNNFMTTTGVSIGAGANAFATSIGINIGSGANAFSTSATQTLTNKRVTPRVLAYTSNGASPAVNTDNFDVIVITGQTVNITSIAATGTPTNAQKLIVSLTAGSGTPTIAWGTSFEASTYTTLPSSFTTSRIDVGFIWNAATSKWRCVAVS